MLFGVHKDAGTLHKVLDPASFAGILISDDAAVYHCFARVWVTRYLRILVAFSFRPPALCGLRACEKIHCV
jgi:hypothetical protein